VAVAALIADGIAELTGEVPPAGIGREGYTGIAQWWENFPSRTQAAKDRVLFTEFDDAYLWDATQQLYNMKVFRGMADIETRQRDAANKAQELRTQGYAKWNAPEVEKARTLAATKEPNDGWVDLKAAEILANLGSFEAARGHIAAARDKFPRLAQVHMALAQEALRDGQARVALGHLETMGELLPAGAKPAAIYASANLKAGDPAAAVPFLRKIASVDPGQAGHWLELAKAQNTACLGDDAIATCREGMEKTGQDAALTAMLARLLAEKDGASPEERKESLALARAAAQLDPNSLQTAEALALALMANGHDGEAKAEAGRIIAQASAAGNPDIVTSLNKTLNRVREKSQR
ncbi:MAG: tetratricopeptide repeat protein, partial [Chthoniobacterales bacterium]